MLEHPAGQVARELVLHERRKPCARVVTASGFGQKVLDVVSYHPVKRSSLGVAVTVLRRKWTEDNDGVVTSGCENPDTSAGDCNWEGREGWPVVCVNWYQAADYCEWNGKRLCTEAEWEYAARGPEGRVYPWDGVDGCDGEPTCEKTNFVTVTMSTDPASCGETLTLAALPEDAGLCDQTPEGVYYMAGNAWEWTQDFLHDTYVGAPTDGSEWAYDLGGRKVARGGRPTFDADPDLRLHRRFAEYPPQRSDTLGFRCCADFKCEAAVDCPGTGMECFEKSNGIKVCRKAPVAAE